MPVSFSRLTLSLLLLNIVGTAVPQSTLAPHGGPEQEIIDSCFGASPPRGPRDPTRQVRRKEALATQREECDCGRTRAHAAARNRPDSGFGQRPLPQVCVALAGGRHRSAFGHLPCVRLRRSPVQTRSAEARRDEPTRRRPSREGPEPDRVICRGQRRRCGGRIRITGPLTGHQVAILLLASLLRSAGLDDAARRDPAMQSAAPAWPRRRDGRIVSIITRICSTFWTTRGPGGCRHGGPSAHPFTAPAVMPSTKYFWTAVKRMMIGMVVAVPIAMTTPQLISVELM